MTARLKKILLLLLAAALLVGVRPGAAVVEPRPRPAGLDRACGAAKTRRRCWRSPPWRWAASAGLISNSSGFAPTICRQDDKFFEAAQLADWITKLEPHFTQVWLFQAWNMAYNISVKFKETPGSPTAGAGSSAASNCCATTACATTPTKS